MSKAGAPPRRLVVGTNDRLGAAIFRQSREFRCPLSPVGCGNRPFRFRPGLAVLWVGGGRLLGSNRAVWRQHYELQLTDLVPLHSDYDRLSRRWLQGGEASAIDQDGDTPRYPCAA
jgi:hypothetical protein